MEVKSSASSQAAPPWWKCGGKDQAAIAERARQRQELRQAYATETHKVDLPGLEKMLNTDVLKGLSTDQYNEALARFGRNELAPKEQTPKFIQWLKATFTGMFNLLLWGGSILCFIAYGLDSGGDQSNLYLGIVLAVVVLITGTFSYFQDASSAAIMEGFKKFLPVNVSVVRDGRNMSDRAEHLVPGDLISLRTGDSISADIRIVRCSDDLQVDNSSLTGESEPQDRTVLMTHENPMETKNLGFFGTKILRGSCDGVVINTAGRTMMGRIAALADDQDAEDTPIRKELTRFIYIISAIAFLLGFIFFGIGMGIDPDFVKNVIFMIGIIVANVPEGLLATVTVSLAVTAQRMAKRKVLVKNLEAVETLGSTTCICSDKTGTLTMNVMTVAHVCYDLSVKAVDVVNSKKGEFDARDPSFRALLQVALLCNNTQVHMEHGEKKLTGDASEQGITRFLDPHFDMRYEDARDMCPKLYGIPFNSSNKWQLSIHQMPSDVPAGGAQAPERGPLLVLKGAPDVMLTFCDRYMLNGQVEPLNNLVRAQIQEAILSLGEMGERVLGFAQLELNPKKYPAGYRFKGSNKTDLNFPLNQQKLPDDDSKESIPTQEEGLVFVGLMAMIDPPRPGVPEAVEICQQGGIKVIMVTGDHPVTARAIARKVNIIRHDTVDDLIRKRGMTPEEAHRTPVRAIVIEGAQLQKELAKSDEEQIAFWNHVLSHENVVFARTSPQQKLLIVEANQLRGEVVAVTGDGVNDAPALSKADIGVAMGIAGTEVAKDAADMIILDDNFASIVNGVEEGRIIFDNLKKSISYTLSSNIPELLPFLAFVIFVIPLPLTTILILCIDLGTDMIPAISFAHENKEADIMSRAPRNARVDRLVTTRLISFAYLQIGVIQCIAGFYAYLVVMTDFGFRMEDLLGIGGADYGKKWLHQCGGDHHFTDTADALPDCDYVSASYPMDPDHQNRALRTAQTAYLLAIVITQWADVIICKTRTLSAFQHGMSNGWMNFGLFFETALISFLMYTPGVNSLFGTEPLAFKYWFCALPFSVLIWLYDEIRKGIMRGNRTGWLAKYTAW